MKYLILGVVIIFCVLVAVCYFFPQINFRPMPKGLCEGTLSDTKPNWVSSLVDERNSHYIAPFEKMNLATMATLVSQRFPRYVIVQSDETHMIAYKQTALFHFTDWLCIRADGSVTSSATMGYSDLGKNRSDVEKIRHAY